MASSAEPNGSATLPPLEAEKVNDAVRSLALLRRIELVLVIMATVAGVLAAGFAAYSAAQVRSCTTPQGKCYRENTVRARQGTREFLQKLDTDHAEIKCLLLVYPADRDAEDQKHCEEKFEKKEPPP